MMQKRLDKIQQQLNENHAVEADDIQWMVRLLRKDETLKVFIEDKLTETFYPSKPLEYRISKLVDLYYELLNAFGKVENIVSKNIVKNTCIDD